MEARCASIYPANILLGLSFFVRLVLCTMPARNVRKAARRVRRARRSRTGRTRKSVRPKNTRRRLQGKTNSLRTAIALGTGLQSAYEASKTVYDSLHNPTGVAKRTKRSRSRTVTKTRTKDNDGTGPYQQWSQRYAQATFGRMKMAKLINRESLVQYFHNFTRFNQGKGAAWIGQATDAASTSRFCPLFVFDLTASSNHVNGTITRPVAGYVMTKSTAGATDGNVKWIPLVGKTLDGSATITTYDTEKSEHGTLNADSYPGGSSVLEWASIEMELWGQQQNHTKYTIELCQFHEDVIPDHNRTLADGGGQYGMFWDAQAKSYTYSPLYAGTINGFKGKKKKVLRRYNVDIDPTTTVETNADPHCKTFRLFFKFNRRCNYDWTKASGQDQAIAEFDDIDAPSSLGANQVQVHPSARIYLYVRASDFNIKNTLLEQGVANTPSVSWKIRTKHSLVN